MFSQVCVDVASYFRWDCEIDNGHMLMRRYAHPHAYCVVVTLCDDDSFCYVTCSSDDFRITANVSCDANKIIGFICRSLKFAREII